MLAVGVGACDAGEKSEGAPGPEGPLAPAEIPSELPLAGDSAGRYGPDALGIRGRWQESAGPGSNVEVRFEDGDLCMQGETAQVLDGDFATYWGAQATLSLCERTAGELGAVSACLEPRAAGDLVGVRFTVSGTALPWIVSVSFPEVGRTASASLWVQAAGETTALFKRVTSPFDSSAPPVNPQQLQAITVRAVGRPEGPQSFDFCLRDLKLLFGEEWGLPPRWLEEPGPGRQVAYVGANLVGAEFGEGNLPGIHGTHYLYPTPDVVERYVAKGMNVFRIPFRWERLQRELYGELHEEELGRLKTTIEAVRAHDAVAILDPHNFARYEDDTSDEVPPKVIGVDIEIDAFTDFWTKLASEFAGDEGVWFGLMNEPHTMPTETWLDAANAAIAAIREAGAKNRLLVPGNGWTGAHSWFADFYGTPNAEAMLGVVDPEDNFVFELHQYFDGNSSGTSDICVSETIGVERVQAVTEWLREHGVQGFLGEFGGSDDPICLGAMDQLLTYFGENSDAWLGWTIWSSSEWNIQHNIRPVNGMDVPQMKVLLRHMDAP